MHPVPELIANRLKGIPDDYILATATEGGGFRGTLTGHMLAEMEAMGISPLIFNFFVGTSAGSANNAMYIAGHANRMAPIYPDYLNQYEFVRWRRALKGHPIISMKILMEHILETEVPADWDKVVESKMLYSVASDSTSLSPRILGPPEDKEDMVQQLYATTHLPILAGRPRTYQGTTFYDGSLAASLPVDEAISLGATHVLALSSRELGRWSTRQNAYERIAGTLYNHWFPGIGKIIREAVESNAQRQLDLIDKNANPDQAPYVFTIDSKAVKLSPVERNISKIRAAGDIGRLAAREAFYDTLSV